MNKKTHKVGEAAAPYTVKKTVKGKVVPESASSAQSNDVDAAFKRVTDKIFFERKELLRKLAH